MDKMWEATWHGREWLQASLQAGHVIAGVDEAGRGPLAGPVVAAAVVLDPRDTWWHGVCDSKQLSPALREQWSTRVHQHAWAVGIGEASVQEIDALNILQATLLAMQRAVRALPKEPTAVWIDGNRAPELSQPTRTVVQGDCSVPAISAASVVAKVYRDRLMLALDAQHPGYGFAQHKGYPTRAHRQVLAQKGPCAAHRRSFKGACEGGSKDPT